MFFILSKTVGYLARPLVIIFILLISAWVIKVKKWRQRLFIAAMTLLVLFTNDFIGNEIMRAWEIPATPFSEIHKKYKVGILLTGVTNSNITPTDRVYFHRGADRVTHTLQLYRLGHIEKILISGGSGTILARRKEADELLEVMQMMGVPREDIMIENQSDNTYESAVAVKKMLVDSVSNEDCLLITSAFHMRRSRACFVKAGFATDTFSVDFLSHNRLYTPDVLIIPKIESLSVWQTLMKEWVGMAAYKVAGYI